MPENLPPNLPALKAGWSWVKLGDVCEINPKPNAKEIDDDVKISFLPMKAVEELTGRIDLTDERKYSQVKKGYTYFGEGDIIFAKITPCMENGKVAITTRLKNGIGIGSTEFHVLRPKNIIINKYLFHFLIQSSYRKHAKRNMTGTAGQLRVPKRFIEHSEIPLPPLPEQKKIVEKIEELFSQLDSGAASLKKAKVQLRRYRQSVLAFAFSGKLVREVGSRQSAVGKSDMLKAAEPSVGYKSNGLPEGWKWVKLGEVIESMQYGTSDKAVGNDKGIPVLRMGNIQEGKLDYTNLKYFDKNYPDLKKYLLDDGDLLFNRTNSAELVGKSALYKKHHTKSIFASYLIRVKVNKSIYSSEFLNYYINSSYGRAFIKSVVSQNVGQANVNGTKLKDMNVPLVPLPQQTQIVSEIEKRFSEADNLEKAIDDSLVKADRLRQSILKKAFEGKLVCYPRMTSHD